MIISTTTTTTKITIIISMEQKLMISRMISRRGGARGSEIIRGGDYY
jgi:hypothetical protein